MRHKDKILKYVDDLISNYYEYDKNTGRYDVSFKNIADHDIDEFAALLLEDKDYASEMIGPDNNNFYTKMVPALQDFLKNPTDKDMQIEFMSAYQTSMRDRAWQSFNYYLTERLVDFNANMREPDYDE